MGRRHPVQVKEALHGAETLEQSLPQLRPHLRDNPRFPTHLSARKLRCKANILYFLALHELFFLRVSRSSKYFVLFLLKILFSYLNIFSRAFTLRHSPGYIGGCQDWPSRSFWSATRNSGRRYPGNIREPGWRKRQDTELSQWQFDFPVNRSVRKNLTQSQY